MHESPGWVDQSTLYTLGYEAVPSEYVNDSTCQCRPANTRVDLQTLIFWKNWEGLC